MPGAERDPIVAILDTIETRSTPGEPLRITAAKVFHDAIDAFDDDTMTALETVGFEAVRDEGEPSEIRVPSVVRMIEAGRPYDHVEIDPEDRRKVMFLGLLALAAERAKEAEEGESP